MKIQITQKQLCEIPSRSLGATVDSVEIVECKEDVKSGKVGEAFHVPPDLIIFGKKLRMILGLKSLDIFRLRCFFRILM